MFTPSAYQYNPRHSTGPSEIQKTARDLTDNAVAAPQTDDLVKLGKRDAWAKFLAYEVGRMCQYTAWVDLHLPSVPHISIEQP